MIERFRLFLEHEDLQITEERDVQAGKKFSVTDGHHLVHCTFYANGTILVQGRDGSLKSVLNAWSGKTPASGVFGRPDFRAGWREWWEPIRPLKEYITALTDLPP